MKQWLYSIFVLVLIITIISIVVPEGKLGKIIKGVFSVILLITVINPLVKIKEVNYDYFIGDNNDFTLQTHYIDYVYNKKIDNLINLSKESLIKIGVDKCEIIIDYVIDEKYQLLINFAQVNLKNAVIYSNEEHIVVVEQVKTIVANVLAIEKEKVFIYE